MLTLEKDLQCPNGEFRLHSGGEIKNTDINLWNSSNGVYSNWFSMQLTEVITLSYGWLNLMLGDMGGENHSGCSVNKEKH